MSDLSSVLVKAASSLEKDEWFKRVYSEVETYARFISLKKERGICVDIGSNVGAFLHRYYSLFDQFICVEPFSVNVDYITKLVEKNNYDNVIVLKNAVGAEENKTLKLRPYFSNENIDFNGSLGNLSTQLYQNSFNKDGWREDSPYEIVYTKTLEQLINENNLAEINLLKIDCEGAEYDFLYEKDLSKVNSIVMELHNFLGHEKHKKLINWIKKTHELYNINGDGITSHYEIGFVKK